MSRRGTNGFNQIIAERYKMKEAQQKNAYEGGTPLSDLFHTSLQGPAVSLRETSAPNNDRKM